MQPLYDNLAVVMQQGETRLKPARSVLSHNQVEISPLAYIRGRTLHRVF